MGYSRKPIYHFKDKNDKGIDKVPVGRMIIIEDYDGEIKSIIKKSNAGLDSNTTLQQLVESGTNITDVGAGSTGKPELSSVSVTVNEGTTTDIIITNYFDTLIYTVESLDESIATISTVGDTIKIEGQEVTEDTTTTVRINAAVAGLTASEWTTITVNVMYVPIQVDTTIQVTDIINDLGTNTGYIGV